jgi:Tfp pilus assembly protein PilX
MTRRTCDTKARPARACSATAGRARAGMAILAALCTLMLIALLVAGGLASVNAAQRSAATNESAALLLTSSDEALTDAVADWRAGSLDSLAVGATSVVPWSDAASGMRGQVSVTALPRGVYWLAAEVWSPAAGQVRRRANLIVLRPSALDSLGRALPPRPLASGAWAQLFQPQ